MGEGEEIPSKLLSLSSSENRDSLGSSSEGGDEEFYEKIEAPKFVDFTVPDHYNPDDRYWFCLRVGCDHNHEEEMDSEAIYKNFVLRVMAARSPNVRLRKALDRNASRTPAKCPLSAPPKSSKPRLSRIAVISSFSKKMAEDKKKAVRPLPKPVSTPVAKTRLVAAKYLTTPRNKKGTSEESSFRSVQHPKPINVEVPKSRTAAKALVFRSPKKATEVKTSLQLRTPISKLCHGMNRLEISSHRKRALGYSSTLSKNFSDSSSRRQLSSQKLQAKPEKSLQTRKGQDTKSGKLIRTQLSKKQESKKLLRSDEVHSLKNNECCDARKLSEPGLLQESSHEEAIKGESSCLDLEGRDESRSDATKADESNVNENITTESCAASVADTFNRISSSEGEQSGLDFRDVDDDKENAAASDENRVPKNTPKQNARKILGMHEKCDQVRKKVTQAQVVSCGPVAKLKKPKPTNPKPFRLRTDERGILKEAVLERRVDLPASQSENANVSTTPSGKLQRKNVNDVQKGFTSVVLKTPKGQERSKSAAAAAAAAASSITPESKKHQEQKMASNAMQRLEKFRKLKSPLPKRCPRTQGLVSRKQELISCLIPGQKLDVIHEASPEASKSSGRRMPRSCTKIQ